jgi:hypothetical protein
MMHGGLPAAAHRETGLRKGYNEGSGFPSMIRIIALVATILPLTGCFVFDNQYGPGGSTPTAKFQIVVTGASYSGTYVWSAVDNAYSAVIGPTTYHVYMDGSGYWVLSYLYGQNHGVGTYATSPVYAPQPVTSGANWSPPGEISNIDDSTGGICRTSGAPDSPVLVGNTLQVTFKASDPQNLVTCQWERSASAAWPFSALIGTGSTYTITSADLNFWIRVIITPTDSTGAMVGSPVSSPPVHVN